jgi:hypothetical protein
MAGVGATPGRPGPGAYRFDQAVPTLLRLTQEDSGYHQPYRYLAACYAHTGPALCIIGGAHFFARDASLWLIAAAGWPVQR